MTLLVSLFWELRVDRGACDSANVCDLGVHRRAVNVLDLGGM